MLKGRLLLTSILGGILLGLYACGGGGGSDGQTTTGQSTVSGPITAFGSIYVNGERYDTSNADIYIEDDPASESDLRVGMIVDVITDQNGNVISVYHDDELEGIVTANNISAMQTTGVLEIMGYSVTVDNNTVFESDVPGITAVDMIEIGNIVEVSGYLTGDSSITATRIEVEAVDLASYLSEHAEGIEVKGIIREHDPVNQRFRIGDLLVSYAGARLDDLPNGIQDDLYVEVKSTQGLDAFGQLVAAVIELEDEGRREHEGDDGDEREVYGFITALTAESITVNGQTFIINNETEVEDGAIGDLQIGDMVEIEGAFNADGELLAEEIELKRLTGQVKLKGVVANITIDNDNNGTLTLNDGTQIRVTNDTLMQDQRDLGTSPDLFFNLAGIAIGDYIEVYAIDNGDGTFTATSIEREDDISS